MDPAQLGSGLDMVLCSDHLNGPALVGPGQGGVCPRDASNLHPAALRWFSPFGGIKQISVSQSAEFERGEWRPKIKFHFSSIQFSYLSAIEVRTKHPVRAYLKCEWAVSCKGCLLVCRYCGDSMKTKYV